MNDKNSPDGAAEGKLTALLAAVGPREVPPAAVMADVRAAVEAEWRATVVRRHRWRQFTGWAAAAGVAVAAIAAWMAGAPQGPGPEPVGTLARVVGDLQQDAGDGRWAPLGTAGAVLNAGARLRTGPAARAALRLDAGVTVRLDTDTLIAFEDGGHATLAAGAVYVDSGAGNGPADFSLETPAGVVRHVGTQYEARLGDQGLRVAIREGRVQVVGPAGDLRAEAGEQLLLSGALAQRSRLAPTDPAWAWVSAITPPFDLEGRSVDSFLDWAARETGRSVEYASPSVAAQARSVTLRGTVEGLTPDEAVAAVLSTTSLRPVVGDGSIRVELAAR